MNINLLRDSQRLSYKILSVFFVSFLVLQCAVPKNRKHPSEVFSRRERSLQIPDCLIGYTELQTNLPGGRQANVKTMRAVVINADGSGHRLLSRECMQPCDTMSQFAGWSPDGGKAIIGVGWKSNETAKWEEENKQFCHIDGEVLYDNYLVDVYNGNAVNVTAVGRISNYNSGLFFWPDDPLKLGFTALINGISHPFKMDIDGRNKIDLTKGSKDFTYGFNASRDGKRIAYHRDYQVYIADADGTNAQHIETGQKFNFGPQWSPDGAWILFVSGERNTKCDPYLVRSDGTGLKKLADRKGYKGSIEFLDVFDFHGGSSDIPGWSADGKSVFYTAMNGNRVELFQVGLDGKTQQLTHSPEGTLHYHPEPSPDGKWVLYGSRREGVRQLFLMKLSDHHEYRITNLKTGQAAMWAHWQPKVLK